MQITRSSVQTQKGPADWFTGDVYIDAVAAPEATSTFAAALVHFTPGARTAWHTHPHGQTIFVTEGVGLLPARGRADRGDPPRRPRVLRARREPLARRRPEPLHGPHRDAAERRDRQPGHAGASTSPTSSTPAGSPHEPDLRLHRPGRARHRRRCRHGARHRPRLRRSPAQPSCSPTSTRRRWRPRPTS